ncbi:TM0106 family RecB-like putative nuclease [Nigerium massiliense]|uniref:TM0106 family RecB-like putative nuclease n=1 Tax=Nigerium massiliense TaxID=1522317 RepID=UPI00058FD417|nr:TM0106 family RecB-like putative nuclease [Nigerium massiliense]
MPHPFTLDAYAARSCSLKTVNAFTPGLTPPSSADVPTPMFFHDADGIEAEVFGRLLAGVDGAVDLRDLADSETREAATAAAIAARAPLIVGGLLPRDWERHRSGRPSALLLDPDRSGYRPVQVKFHRVLESRPTDEVRLEYSTLDAPRDVRTHDGRRFRWAQRLRAALQLAHYRRMLEAMGAASDRAIGGVVGLERVVVPGGDPSNPLPVITWLDLDEPVVPPNPETVPVPEDAEPLSTLQRYDAEHARRVELATSAMEGTPPAATLLPVIHRECAFCPWLAHCTERLDADDLSVRLTKIPLDVHEVRTLRSLGLATVDDLATADLDALEPDYLPRVSHRVGGAERLRLVQRRARLIAAGVELERQTTGPLDLAGHDLEIDLDVETSADDRVYLWGFLVDDRRTGERYYHHVSAFAPLDRTQERDLAFAAMSWLRALVDGRDAAVYHYSDYEVVRLKRLLSAMRGDQLDLAEWARGFAADAFVDLFTTVRTNFFGANGLGLKVVAPATTPFRWRDEDPSGLNSQSWFDEAAHDPDPLVRETSRRRVLDYNEDDVRATWHLRAWLRTLK